MRGARRCAEDPRPLRSDCFVEVHSGLGLEATRRINREVEISFFPSETYRVLVGNGRDNAFS